MCVPGEASTTLRGRTCSIMSARVEPGAMHRRDVRLNLLESVSRLCDQCVGRRRQMDPAHHVALRRFSERWLEMSYIPTDGACGTDLNSRGLRRGRTRVDHRPKRS